MLFYKRFGYDPYKQWYWILRIDSSYPFLKFYKNENKQYEINRLLKLAIEKTEIKLPQYVNKFAFIYERN